MKKGDDYDLYGIEEDEKEKKKNFSWFRAVSTTVLILFVFTFLFYSISIITTKSKVDENDANYKFCLDKIGISGTTWETYTAFAVKNIDFSQTRIWNTFIKLENWNKWNPIVENAEWVSGNSFKEGNTLKQTLNLGFPVGTIESNEKIGEVVDGETVAWWKDQNGVKSCHVWSFKNIDNNKTLVSNIEVFHGINIALAKPFIANSWQNSFEKAIDNLINEAKK